MDGYWLVGIPVPAIVSRKGISRVVVGYSSGYIMTTHTHTSCRHRLSDEISLIGQYV